MQKELANGMTATYVDESKKLAADRWLVKLRCRIAMPLAGWMLDELAGDDPQANFCRAQFAGRLAHEIVMERNFIDAADRERVLAELIERLENTVLGYLEREVFVRQLFAVKRAEMLERYAQQLASAGVDEEDEGPEPADFSACFR